MDPIANILPEYESDLARLGASGAKFTFFLHLPKTGGTSIAQAIQSSRKIVALGVPDFSLPREERENQSSEYMRWQSHRYARFMSRAVRDNSGLEIALMTSGHTTYEHASRLIEMLHAPDEVQFITSVRPAAARLISAFRDYWSQVERAKNFRVDESVNPQYLGKETPEDFDIQTLRHYLDDSAHYLDSQGNIDASAWFRAFRDHGSGVPFLMDDVFVGDVDAFVDAVRIRRLRIVPMDQIAKFVREIGGVEQKHARQSSSPTPEILRSLKEAEPTLLEIAQRDAPYDNFLARYLKKPEFRQVNLRKRWLRSRESRLSRKLPWWTP